MFNKDRHTLESKFADVTEGLEVLNRKAERTELILMMREPGSAAAADAYDGLRKQVVSAVTDRLAHLTQLVQFRAALGNGADTELLTRMVHGWCESSGLGVINDSHHPDAEVLFELIEDDGEGELSIVEPAYVDSSSGRIIRRGRATRRRRLATPTFDSVVDLGSPPLMDATVHDDATSFLEPNVDASPSNAGSIVSEGDLS